MATAFLTLNGVGLGHLVRATVVARALTKAGERPAIFSQGLFPVPADESVPGRAVPSLWKATEAVRQQIGGDLRSWIDISIPAVVIEDTHPSPVRLPGRVRRVLLVRPTTFAYLRRLHESYARVYAAFLLTDAPGSPTWPYTADETAAILSWPHWDFIGPIYRQPTADAVGDVRRRYDVNGTQPVLLCTPGGGGQHGIDDQSPQRFVDFCSQLVDTLQLDRRTRLLFVRGPYFPTTVDIDSRFEVVDHEPQLAALMACADGIVARAGFNSLWECLTAGVPFWPFVGTTFDEPVEARLAQLSRRGLVAPDAHAFWNNQTWRQEFRRRCVELTSRWPGVPTDADGLRQMIMGIDRPMARLPLSAPASGPLAQTARIVRRGLAGLKRRAKTPLVVRVDDIVSLDATVDWLLRLLASRNVCASLEVIPYLATLSEPQLTPYDPSNTRLEVSQHGWAHIPQSGSDRRRFECATEPRPRDADDIRRGKRALEEAFPRRFRGGFSAPFDALPEWLPAVWRDAGGHFVSCLSDPPPQQATAPLVVAGWDIWDWPRDQPHEWTTIKRVLDYQTARHGHTGIALHPRCLRSHVERRRLVELLDRLVDRGFEPTPLHSLVRASEGAPRTSGPEMTVQQA